MKVLFHLVVKNNLKGSFSIDIQYHLLSFLFSEEESPLSVVESSPSPLINHQTPEETDQRQRSSSSSSHSDTQRNEVHKTDNTPQENETKSATDDHYSSEKETSIKQKPYNHDILVIETQPPKVKTIEYEYF